MPDVAQVTFDDITVRNRAIDGNGREIDLLIFQDNTLYPLEFKQKTNPSPKDIKHFEVLSSLKDTKIGEGGVICLSQDLLPLGEKNRIIPLWAI